MSWCYKYFDVFNILSSLVVLLVSGYTWRAGGWDCTGFKDLHVLTDTCIAIFNRHDKQTKLPW